MDGILEVDFTNLKAHDIDVIKAATKENASSKVVPVTFYRGVYYLQKAGFNFYRINATTDKGYRTFYMPLKSLSPQNYEDIKSFCSSLFGDYEEFTVEKFDTPYSVEFSKTFSK